MTMPRTSPIAQPVRQCSVALSATALSARPEVGSSSWWWASAVISIDYTLAGYLTGFRPGRIRWYVAPMSAMREAMWTQPQELGRLLADPGPAEAAAERLRGRELLLVG